jgi:hypothetical protein
LPKTSLPLVSFNSGQNLPLFTYLLEFKVFFANYEFKSWAVFFGILADISKNGITCAHLYFFRIDEKKP